MYMTRKQLKKLVEPLKWFQDPQDKDVTSCVFKAKGFGQDEEGMISILYDEIPSGGREYLIDLCIENHNQQLGVSYTLEGAKEIAARWYYDFLLGFFKKSEDQINKL